MKAVKFIGMIVLSLLMGLNFASCNNEDDVDASKLEGEWFLKNDVGYELDKTTGEKDEWNEGEGEYPEKIIIKNVNGNTYTGESFTKYNDVWESDGGSFSFTLEGNKLIPVDTEDTEEQITIKSLTSDKMVLVSSYEDDNYKFYEEMTYTR